MENKLKKIELKVKEQWPLDKFKAVCEMIKDIELQILFLEDKKGWEMANLISGSVAVEERFKKLNEALKERKTERQFLYEYLQKNPS